MNDKTRRNIWLALAILSIAAIVDRAIKVTDGTAEWWSLVSAIIIFAFCFRFYMCYRNKVNNGQED